MKQTCDTMLVIGNGFDLTFGLKTSYTDFMKWFNRNYSFRSYLKEFLNAKLNMQRWIDIENELIYYSKYLYNKNQSVSTRKDNERKAGRLRQEYKDLCKELCKYLIEEEKRIDDLKINLKNSLKNHPVTDILKIINREPVFVINFNYTDLISYLTHDSVVSHHIHGTLKDKENIVFGVQDSADLDKRHSFLYKSHNRVLNVNHLNERFEDAKHILFYGYSLGQTDHSYFEDFFREQSTKGCERKKFDFFYYGQEGYDDLFWQLRTLTGNRITQFKQFNDVEFINVIQ